MRPEVAICPTCEFPHRNNLPLTRTVTWSDACACSDYSNCAFHNMGGWDKPIKRPPEDVLEARRAKVEERQNAEFEKKKERFARAEALEKEVARLREYLVTEVGTSCDAATPEDFCGVTYPMKTYCCLQCRTRLFLEGKEP